MDEKVRQGWPTGLAPYGYINVDDRSKPVIPHPEKSKTIIRIFNLYGSGRYTFKSLADQLQREGHIYRNSQPRFNRTSLSYILNNRFYIGELVRNGHVYRGQYCVLIDRTLFDACQDVLKGKNRRTGSPDIMLSSCILRCACCGFAITGEQIRRKLRDGGRNVHVYDKCGNNHQPAGHPKVRWKEEDVEVAILDELGSFRLPTPRIAGWFRSALMASFNDVGQIQANRKKMLTKRRTELANMQDRLLNGYLAGTIDEAIFNDKSAELKCQAEDVAQQLDKDNHFDATQAETALAVFDFSQNLVDIWRGSNFAVRRQILDCVSSNRALSDVSLVLTKRKPFDFLVERPFLDNSRGERI